MTLENKNLKDENTNLQNLLQFYEDNEEKPNQPNESESKDKEKIKELEIQIMNLEETIKKKDEKIKELEEEIIIKNNELEVKNKDLIEQKEIAEKALEVLNEKGTLEDIERNIYKGTNKKSGKNKKCC